MFCQQPQRVACYVIMAGKNQAGWPFFCILIHSIASSGLRRQAALFQAEVSSLQHRKALRSHFCIIKYVSDRPREAASKGSNSWVEASWHFDTPLRLKRKLRIPSSTSEPLSSASGEHPRESKGEMPKLSLRKPWQARRSPGGILSWRLWRICLTQVGTVAGRLACGREWAGRYLLSSKPGGSSLLL